MSDFDANGPTKLKDNRTFGNSGLSGRAEDGLSSIERGARGELQSGQKTAGATQRRVQQDEAAGSKNGKNFNFRT